MVAVERGCGSRSPGGVYLVTSLGRDGVPLRDCVIDPPIPVDAQAVGLSPQGMAPARTSLGHVRILDWVGEGFYPNTADYVEEVALFGSSRRVPKTFDFSLLTPKSQHVLCHPRAIVTNRVWLAGHLALSEGEEHSYLNRLRRAVGGGYCPFKGEAHPGVEPGAVMCAAMWWEVLLPKSVRFDEDPEGFEAQCRRDQSVVRRMPSFSYEGYTLPDRDRWVPEFALGAFLALPISRIEVVRDPEEGSHLEGLAKARRAQLPVVEVDE